MCGFFAFSTGLSPQAIAEKFNLKNIPRSFEDLQSLKFYPKAQIPTISKSSPNILSNRYWSLIPNWWKKDLEELTFSTFNARAETLASTATFRNAWSKRQRCLIPASWFYEFHTATIEGKKIKIPYKVASKSDEIMTLAGLYDSWISPSGDTIESVTIITTSAIYPLVEVHARQPVIISESDREKWLNKESSIDSIEALLKPESTLIISKLSREFNTAFGENVTLEMVG